MPPRTPIGGFGTRYLTVEKFIAHYRRFDLEVSAAELEYYAKHGVMQPTARVCLPIDYVAHTLLAEHGDESGYQSGGWPEIAALCETLVFSEEDYATLSDKELIHVFDRQMGSNPLLDRPSAETYTPWSADQVEVEIPDYGTQSAARLQHFYSDWQIHELNLVQHILFRLPPQFFAYENDVVIHEMPVDDGIKSYPLMSGFPKHWAVLDAASAYATIRDRANTRLFALIPDRFGIRSLTKSKAKQAQKQVRTGAIGVIEQHSLSTNLLYDGLLFLLRYMDQHKQVMNPVLLLDLGNIADRMGQLIRVRTRRKRDFTASAIARRGDPRAARVFRHLDERQRIADRAKQALELAVQRHNLALSAYNPPPPTFPIQVAEEIVRYCMTTGPYILLYTLEQGWSTDRQWERRTPEAQYIYLKQLATSLEYFIRGITPTSVIPQNKEGLTAFVQETIKHDTSLWKMLDAQLKTRRHRAPSVRDFLDNLIDLRKDAKLRSSVNGWWAQQFMIAILARNLTVHTYPDDRDFISQLHGEMVNAVLFALLYEWDLAKRQRWLP